MAQQIQAGEGWRVGWNPDAGEFCGLVGGDEWALELTEAELKDFCRLLLRLADMMQQMATELMSEEKLQCEVESDRLWLEADGFPHSYQLRLLLLTGRRSEGSWPAPAVPGLLQVVRRFSIETGFIG
jgi:hypothetical protein